MASMSSKLTVILDGDDTLWQTQEIYDEIKRDFVSLLEEIGIQEENTISRLDELDAQRVVIKGFTIDRFLESMMILYAQLSTSHNLHWDIKIEKKILNFGNLLRKPPRLYEDTISSLEILKRRARIYLFSAGQRNIQVEKVNNLGLTNYFESLYIVPTKNKEILQDVILDVGIQPSESWMVGNSLKSDVIPAVSAGLNTILVDRGSWKYDHSVSAMEDKLHFFRVHTLSDAVSTILEKT